MAVSAHIRRERDKQDRALAESLNVPELVDVAEAQMPVETVEVTPQDTPEMPTEESATEEVSETTGE